LPPCPTRRSSDLFVPDESSRFDTRFGAEVERAFSVDRTIVLTFDLREPSHRGSTIVGTNVLRNMAESSRILEFPEQGAWFEESPVTGWLVLICNDSRPRGRE